jgi:hypothetical protein
LSEFYRFLFAFDPSVCVGVDNALVKGKIANTRLTCALVCRDVMSDCQEMIRIRLSLSLTPA